MDDMKKTTSEPKAQEHTVLDDIEQIDVEATLEKYDSESSFIAGGAGNKFTARVITVIAVCMSVFHLYMASPWGTMPSAKVRAVHLGFVLALIFLMAPIIKTKKGKTIKLMPMDYLLAAAGVV